MSGKGSHPARNLGKKYKDNYDSIFRKKEVMEGDRYNGANNYNSLGPVRKRGGCMELIGSTIRGPK